MRIIKEGSKGMMIDILSEEYQDAFEAAQIEAQENYGDISEETRNRLKSIEEAAKLDIGNKIENVAYSIRKKEAEIDARKAMINTLRKKNESANKYIESAKTYIRCTMEAVEIDKVKGTFMNVSLGKSSPRVVVNDMTKIDPKFIIETKSPALILIKAELGKDDPVGVDGAEIEYGERRITIS